MDLFDDRNRQRNLPLHAKTVDVVWPHSQRHLRSCRHRLRRIIIHQRSVVIGDTDPIEDRAPGNFVNSISEADCSVAPNISGDRSGRSVVKFLIVLFCTKLQNTADVQILQDHTLLNDQVSNTGIDKMIDRCLVKQSHIGIVHRESGDCPFSVDMYVFCRQYHLIASQKCIPDIDSFRAERSSAEQCSLCSIELEDTTAANCSIY